MLDLIEPRVHTRSMPKGWYTVTQVAKLLGLTRRGVLKAIERGNLSAEMFGNQYIIQKEALDKFRKERRKPGRPRAKRKYTRQGDS